MNTKAIYALYPDVVTIREQENGSVLCYNAKEELVEINATTAAAWVDPNAYKYQRVAEYPTWNEQLDNIYHNGIDVWKADIKAIKDKYPKGDE